MAELLLPIFFGVILLLAVLAVIQLGRFLRRRAQALWRLQEADLVATRQGMIECGTSGRIHGPAVLILHGGLGGWDQGIALAEDLRLPDRFRVIAPSRPGYLRTPLATGATPDEAADAMAALLDTLNLHAASLVAISGGGPTALAVAARHSRRVTALAMISAISLHHEQPGMTLRSPLGSIIFSKYATWLTDYMFHAYVGNAGSRASVRRLLGMTELGSWWEIRARAREVCRRPEAIHAFKNLFEHMSPLSPRKDGLNNDLAQFAAMGNEIRTTIDCPTLVVHGRIDGNVPIAHAEAVQAAAPHAESLIIDGAGHLLWLHPRCDEVRQRVRSFLETHANDGAT